jgi:hypothetical protein
MGVGHTTVQRIWKEQGLKPHRCPVLCRGVGDAALLPQFRKSIRLGAWMFVKWPFFGQYICGEAEFPRQFRA